MSDSDDRMERAERIREMRQSREPGDENDADDGDADATPTDEESDGDVSADQMPDNGDASGDPVDGAADVIEALEAATEASDADPETLRSAAQAASADAGLPGVEPPGPDEPDAGTVAASQPSAPAADAPADGLAPLGGSMDFSLPGQDEMEAAAGTPTDADSDEGSTGAARARGSAATAAEPSVRVLEFTVGDQIYCIDIECVEEIVKRESVTRVPNTDDYVEGVVDLRGQITTILDTKQLLDVNGSGSEGLLVIFAPDAFEEHGTVGWVVDEVRQVVPVMDSQERSAPSEEKYVRGIVDREGEDDLVVWINPGDAMASAVAVDGGE